VKEKRDIAFCDTTELMVYGHEPWLEVVGSDGRTGGSIEVHVKWGHNMQTDGLARKEGMTALVVAPGGDKQESALTDGGPDYCQWPFKNPHFWPLESRHFWPRKVGH
jgi:hypothetical protein